MGVVPYKTAKYRAQHIVGKANIVTAGNIVRLCLISFNDISLRDAIFYFVKRYFCIRKNDISQGETIFANGEMHDVQMQNEISIS